MTEFMFRMVALDANSLTLVILICGWGFMIMRAMMPIAGLAVASFPLLVLGALAAHTLMQDTNLVASLEKGPGLALTTGIGMSVVLVFLVVAVRLGMMVKDSVGRRPRLLEAQD